MAEQPQQPIGGPKPTHVIQPNFGKVTPRIVQADQLSAAERILLEKQFGYDGTSPLPSDLGTKLETSSYDPAEFARQRQSILEDAAQAMPPHSIAKPTGLNPDTVPTQQLNISDAELEQLYASRAAVQPRPVQPPVTGQSFVIPQPNPQTLPQPGLPYKTTTAAPVGPSQSDQFERLRTSGVETIMTQKEVGELHPDIAGAFTATQQELENASQQQPQQSQQPPQQLQQAQQAQPQPEPVSQSSAEEPAKPKTRADVIEERHKLRDNAVASLNPEDLQRYKQAVITGELYSKTYTGWGGELQMTFYDAAGDDEDALLLQRTINDYKRRYQQTDDNSVAEEATFRLAVTACMRKVIAGGTVKFDVPTTGSVTNWVSQMDRKRLCPVDLHDDDTDLYAWSHYLYNHILTGPLRQFAATQFRKFQVHLATLQFIGQDPESF